MPRPIAVPIRQVMFRRWQAGESVAGLAEAFGLAQRTVRHLVRRFRQHGEQGIAPSYRRPASAPAEPLVQAALELRQAHPTWGAGLIRVWLAQQHVGSRLPSERTLQRWFRRCDLAAAPPGRRPGGKRSRARQPHEVWQIDASERLKLQTQRQASWLRMVDEHSGAVLATTVFPPRTLGCRATTRRSRGVAAGLPTLGPSPADSGR